MRKGPRRIAQTDHGHGSRKRLVPDDRHEITERLARLAESLDTRNWPRIAAAFTPDATAYGRTGADEILAVVKAHLGGCGPSQHLLGNHRVSLDGDHARSLTYARVYHQGAGTYADRFFECCGEYDDHWLRTDEGWRITSRVFTMTIRIGDFGVLRPEAPDQVLA